AADLVTISGAMGGTIDMGAGADVLTIGADPVTLTVSNVESILGDASVDLITLTGTITGAAIDLAGENDRVITTGNTT
ncbi:hypothetical protein J8J17_26795, partial [Mycobacterium tuberculosis]|nr:hypothetical protein [Mycobacterium tuberculosis]